MCELVAPTTSSLMEPEVKNRKHNKRIPKYEVSICRLPSQFELVESAQDSYSTPTSGALTPLCPPPSRRPKQKVFHYIDAEVKILSE